MQQTRVLVSKYGSPDVLHVVQEPLRQPAPGQIRVRVQSIGVALADVMRRQGVYPMSPTPPFTPGYDAVGIVDEIGEGVTHLENGQKVAVFYPGTGAYASYLYATEEEIIRLPQHLDATVAVAGMLNYITAYQMLHRFANVSTGERILIHGASGGAGTALLELGRLAGLQMFGTASANKHPILTTYGARAIDYRTQDFVDVVRQEAPEGIDVVFDPIGGENWNRSLQVLSRKGRFMGYGYTSVLQQGDVNGWATDWAHFAGKKTTEAGNPIYLYSITNQKKERLDWFREDAQQVVSLMAEGIIHPLVSHRIPLTEVAYAHQLLEQSQSTGKIVLLC